MKFSKKFERDFKWFLSMRHIFDFDGALAPDIDFDIKGVDGKVAYFLFDSQGKKVPTKHPLLLLTLLKVKGSVNLHIKMYAEDRASGVLPYLNFNDEICKPYKVPQWFIDAVERQKTKYPPYI